jgi:DnaJ like chaperone protein
MHDINSESVPDPSPLHWNNYTSYTQRSEGDVFMMGVIGLGAKMAKADGRVTHEEIAAFKRVFHINPAQEESIGELFDRARMRADGFEPYAFQLAQTFHHKQAVLEDILSGLFIIAGADYPHLHPKEITFLKRVSYIFGFNPDDFSRIAAKSGFTQPPPAEKPKNQTSEAFILLGITETATAEQIKAAYRALIREHHPDKLAAQGKPASLIATATEKMKRINVAYDTVCKIRGIK